MVHIDSARERFPAAGLLVSQTQLDDDDLDLIERHFERRPAGSLWCGYSVPKRGPAMAAALFVNRRETHCYLLRRDGPGYWLETADGLFVAENRAIAPLLAIANGPAAC